MFWIFLFLLMLFIRPQDWAGSPVYAMPVNYLVLIGGLIAGYMSSEKQRGSVKNLQNYTLLLFVLTAYISNAGNGNFPEAVDQFFALFKRYIAYFMLLLLLDTPQKVFKTMLIAMLMAVVLVFQGMYQNATGVGWAMQQLHTTTGILEQSSMYGFKEFGARIFWIGAWDGPNVLSLVFLVSSPFCLEKTFEKGAPFFHKLLYAAAFAFMGYGIALTNSRGGFLAFALASGILFVLRFGVKKLPLILLCALPIFLFLAPARMKELNTQESSANERTWLWEQGLNMARSNPVFGIGKGQFTKYADLIAHNNFVGNLAETGLPGLIIYISVLYVSLKGLFLVIRKFKDKPQSDIPALARIVFATAAGFYIATFFVVMELEIFYYILALCSAVFVLARARDRELKLSFGFKDAALISSGAVIVVFMIWLIAENKIG